MYISILLGAVPQPHALCSLARWCPHPYNDGFEDVTNCSYPTLVLSPSNGSMTSNVSWEHSPSNRPLTTSDNVRRQSAAFRGATHAFSQSATTTKAPPDNHSGINGALAAASSAGARGPKHERVSAGTYADGKQSLRSPIKRSQTSQLSELRDPTRQTSQSREQSPSHVAALLATSRATPTRIVSGSSTPRSLRPSPLQSLEDLNAARTMEDIPAADTTSLVKLFESKEKNIAPVTHSVRHVTKPPPMTMTPTTKPPSTRSVSSAITPQAEPQIRANRARTLESSAKALNAGAAAAATNLAEPATRKSLASTTSARSAPEPPPPRRSGKRPSVDGSKESTGNTASTEEFLNDAAAKLQPRSGRPTLPKRRTDSAITSIITKPATTSRPPLASYQSSDKSHPEAPRLSRKPTRRSDTYVPQLTIDSLANAMVASSLASSRAPSPSKPPPLPLPRRHSKRSLFHHNHSSEQASRDTSPFKGGMRQTMRDAKSSSEDEKHRHGKRSHGIKKHPHKHHEGDRKRYRTEIMERERKRYEGVWAANKGLLLPPDTPHSVCNIIVRDIWKRSRLPNDVLEEVWDLVDTQGVGRLEREEFVVGMWLIDQRLKGNKLPIKVSESVWSSVRRLTGVNMPRNRR